MILVGKNCDDASGLVSDVQAELQYNPLFINDFGSQVTLGSWEEGDFVTSDGIQFIAVGRGQSPRGIRNREKRPNYCSCDDIDDDELVQNPDRVGKVVDWILGSLYGALAIKQSRFVMVGNRIHKKSVLAHIVGDTDENQPKRKGIFHSKIKAVINGRPSWPERYTMEELQRKFDRMGYYLTQREYFHNPVVKGKIFKSEWITWGKVPALKDMDMIVGYLDPSYKPKTTNDYKAFRVWGAKGHRRYLLKSFVRQTSITEVVKFMYDYYELTRDKCVVNFYMEEVFLQGMFFDDFEAEAIERKYYLPVAGDNRQKPDKFSRIQSLSPLYERGVAIYDERERANPDCQTGLEQLLGFEKGSNVHDDAPDADEGALFILNKVGRVNSAKPVLGKRRSSGW
jgi:phage terminase large subunit-like protein